MKLTADLSFRCTEPFKALMINDVLKGKNTTCLPFFLYRWRQCFVGWRDTKISLWVGALGQKPRSRFRYRKREGKHEVPSRTVIRNALICVNPEQLEQAPNAWNAHYAQIDESLAIDGKTTCSMINEKRLETHIMSAIGHQSGLCYTQKKSAH